MQTHIKDFSKKKIKRNMWVENHVRNIRIKTDKFEQLGVAEKQH